MSARRQIAGHQEQLINAMSALYTMPRHQIVFTENMHLDCVMSDSDGHGNMTFTMHYDNAYKFIFSLKGNVDEGNVKMACNIALNRVMGRVEEKIRQALK